MQKMSSLCFAATRQILKLILLFFSSSLTSIEGKPLMEKNQYFPRCTNCSYLQLWNFLAALWFKAHRIHWHCSGSWHHQAFLSSFTTPTTLFGATALPKVWWSPAQAAPLAAPLAEKVEEEKHICVFPWTISPCSQSLFTAITCKRARKNTSGVMSVTWFARTERI